MWIRASEGLRRQTRRMAEVLLAAETDIETAAYAYDAAMSGGERRHILETRLALCAALRADGWQAPPEVQRQIDFDLFELRQLDTQRISA